MSTTQQSPGDIPALLHKLNQPLTAIGNYAEAGKQMLEGGNVDHDKLRQVFEKITGQCARTSAISQELREALEASPVKSET